jgi:hypothetical protein
MGRIYTVSFAGTVTNAGGDTDLIEILPAAEKPVKLRGFSLAQTSEVGDTAEEGLRISVMRLPATVTSGNGGRDVRNQWRHGRHDLGHRDYDCRVRLEYPQLALRGLVSR